MIKNTVIGILLAIIVAGICYIEFLKIKRDELASEKKSLKVQLDMSEDNVSRLRGAIDNQNSAIEKIKKDADERYSRNQVELRQAKKVADQYKSRADEILRATPSQPGNMCASAEDLINQEIVANVK